MDTLENIYRQAPAKRDFARNYLTYLNQLTQRIDPGVIEEIIEAMLATAERGSTTYFLGNGGAAATASHFANDMGQGTRIKGFKRLRAISLADNVPVLTALANDRGYENVFLLQLEDFLKPEDVVMALSVSGNSPNVIKAVEYAKTVGATVIGVTGFGGGALRELADISLHIETPQGEYGPVEDIFQILDHLIYSYIKLSRQGHL